MLFDMHCHTLEGSPDALVSINEVVTKLKEKGYSGVLVTDHNSYKGYNSLSKEHDDFVVLRGVEYDTKDAGHMLIILPSNIDYEIFTLRGMRLEDVIKIVHVLGGILGPAHPFDYYKLGLCNNPIWLVKVELLKQLDFIETFNSCGREYGNELAKKLAEFLDKPQFGGSDSHRYESVGLGYTEIEGVIKSEDDLIRIIRNGNSNTTKSNGVIFKESLLHKHKIITSVGSQGCNIITQSVALIKRNKHRLILETLGLI